MTRDPIVEEVRQAREKLLRDSGGTIKTLMEHLRESERKEPDKLVTLEEWRRQRGTPSSGPRR